MRRSVYYMGRSFTQRHLNACFSPLATGFVRPNAFSSTAHGLVASPLCGSGCIGSGVVGANGALVASTEASLSQLLAPIIVQGKSISMLAKSFRIETMMSSLREECFNLCCKDLYKDAELTKDEVHCIDRCSWRYLHTNKIISNSLDRKTQGGGKKLM
ncbi:Tim10/DDP zinc finger family protein [Leishmania donovani]|uniref:Tim10/DDP zinc finger family protein n=1 Tax=Leishmania donovani TaxID=5661 RepID=A0A504Y712_LEIDO|nr:Tim10/DDP zinc finger family protein [Leishmania donovani]